MIPIIRDNLSLAPLIHIRKTIQLIKTDGEQLSAITYVVKEPSTGHKTSMAYVQHILDGLNEHAMPDEYRQYVVSRIIQNNPELQSLLAGHLTLGIT